MAEVAALKDEEVRSDQVLNALLASIDLAHLQRSLEPGKFGLNAVAST